MKTLALLLVLAACTDKRGPTPGQTLEQQDRRARQQEAALRKAEADLDRAVSALQAAGSELDAAARTGGTK